AALRRDLLHALGVGAKVLGPMSLRVLALSSVAVGVSSITRRKGLAQALFAGLVVGSYLLTNLLAATTRQAWITGLGITGSAEMLGEQVMGARRLVGWHAAV